MAVHLLPALLIITRLTLFLSDVYRSCWQLTEV